MSGGTVTQVTAGMIKELRVKTGVSMSKCKEALVEAEGDLEQAIVILRKKGMASASKKEGREAKEGSIAVCETETTIALVELNAETDFVANNEIFLSFLKEMAQLVAEKKPSSVEELLALPYPGDESVTVDQHRAIIIQKIGENIQVRRLATFERNGDSSIGVYSHMGGKIVSLVEVKGSADESELARGIAMHVAAARPQYLNPETIPASVIEQEREIAKEQVKGKPEHIMDKILDGKVRAFQDEMCLTCQKFIRDDKKTVQQVVGERSKESGKELSLTSYTCWKIGE